MAKSGPPDRGLATTFPVETLDAVDTAIAHLTLDEEEPSIVQPDRNVALCSGDERLASI